jgi:hypothetical protein
MISAAGSRVPLTSILPQVQLEAILWGIGTALGELPPYFISRAASISGSTVDGMEELDGSSTEDSGFMATHLNRVKRWLLTHSQHLNFFTVLVLASVSMHPPIYFTFCSSKWIMTVFTVSYNIFCFLGFNDQDLTITHCFDLIVGSKSFV